jgi:hypothetical protein
LAQFSPVVRGADQHLLERAGLGLAEGGGVAVAGIGQTAERHLQALGRRITHHVQPQTFDLARLECPPSRVHGTANLTGLVVSAAGHHHVPGGHARLAVQTQYGTSLEFKITVGNGLGQQA